ncbi:hypothetical protein [Arenibacter sp. NBRC 103722]|uniref:hypothetical protein n=1 Tax=Arenibacter sp. NBRC 103722 TaxID=1113929 RepID=UPI0011AF7231|nr:hypothetical protein [Arenibacter sp. NBRC 103722]
MENTDDLIWIIDNNYRLMGYNSTFSERRRTQVRVTPRTGDNVLREYLFLQKPAKIKELYDRALGGYSFLAETENYENGTSICYELSFKTLYLMKKDLLLDAVSINGT